jgi:beta-glucosidase
MIDETSLSARVDELIAAMTPAEKAGQLTQYFYFGSPAETIDLPDVEGVPANPSAAVEAAMGRGEVGSLLFVTDPASFGNVTRDWGFGSILSHVRQAMSEELAES